MINTIWAVFVAAAACLLLFHGGSAAQAMTIYFTAHILSAGLVLFTLKRKDHIPAGMTSLFLVGSCSMVALVALALARTTHPALIVPITLLMVLIVITTTTLL